jgi:lipoyl-dependent peroxiredoxin
MAERKADARWAGDLKGTLRLGSGAYTAAHAGCFSMALANELSQAGHEVESVETTAKVSLGEDDGGPAITGIELTTKVSASGLDDDEFQGIADGAKQNCPVSKALAATDITLDAELTSG